MKAALAHAVPGQSVTWSPFFQLFYSYTRLYRRLCFLISPMSVLWQRLSSMAQISNALSQCSWWRRISLMNTVIHLKSTMRSTAPGGANFLAPLATRRRFASTMGSSRNSLAVCNWTMTVESSLWSCYPSYKSSLTHTLGAAIPLVMHSHHSLMPAPSSLGFSGSSGVSGESEIEAAVESRASKHARLSH